MKESTKIELDVLMVYLEKLAILEREGHNCHEEINKAIKKIERHFGLNE